jgi:ketosteroid isomerase-like protein
MKWREPLFCVLAVSLATASGAQDRSVRSDQQNLVELERSWNTAFYRKDLAFLQSILADEFIATYDDGSRGDKAKELALAAEFDQQVDSALQDDFTVKVYGETAVVWFSLHLVGPSQGRPLALTFRYVDVFVWRAGRWQCVETQSTKVTAQ